MVEDASDGELPQGTPAEPMEAFADAGGVAGRPATSNGAVLRSLLLSLVINAALPFLTYTILTGQGMGTVPALVIGGVWNVLELVIEYARHRRLDSLSVIVLIFLAVSIVSSLISGSVQFTLLKESAGTALFGLVLLGSLLAPRPVMFYFGRHFATDRSDGQIAWWNGLWQYPQFRHGQRLLTAVWGVALLGEAVIRAALTFVLPTGVMVALNHFLPLVIIAILVMWTIAFGKRRSAAGVAGAAVAARDAPA